MPSLYPIIATVAVAGGLYVVYEKYFAETIEDWVSEFVDRRRESRRRQHPQRVPAPGFGGSARGGDENEGRKSDEREREMSVLEREDGRGMGSRWDEGDGEPSGVRRRGARSSVRRDEEVDFDTLLKHTAGGAPPPTQILFSFSQPSSPLPPLAKPLPPPPPHLSSPAPSLAFSASSHQPQPPAPRSPPAPPSMSTSWAHLPPSASLLVPTSAADGEETLTLRSGSTGLLGGSRIDESVASWMSAASWNGEDSEAGGEGSVWRLASGAAAAEGVEFEEDGWSDVGGAGGE